MGNQSNIHTEGDGSPVIGGGFKGQYAGRDLTVYGDDARGHKVPVKFKRTKVSKISATSANVVAAVISLAAAVLTAYTAISDSVGLRESLDAISANNFFEPTMEFFTRNWILLLLLVTLIIVAVGANAYARRRRLTWPNVAGRRSLRRSLYPIGDTGKFIRADAFAECWECKDSNRPNQFAKIKKRYKNGNLEHYYKCRNRHDVIFNELSVIAPDPSLGQ